MELGEIELFIDPWLPWSGEQNDEVRFVNIYFIPGVASALS